jgi:hypothetical protein
MREQVLFSGKLIFISHVVNICEGAQNAKYPLFVAICQSDGTRIVSTALHFPVMSYFINLDPRRGIVILKKSDFTHSVSL